MSINIEHMVEDNVQSHLIKLASMSSSDLFEKIAIHVENPHMFKHFMGSNEEAPVWDFAYAAGLITRAEADLMNVYENGGRAPWTMTGQSSIPEVINNPGGLPGSNDGTQVS